MENFATKEKYADLIGLPVSTIDNWMGKRWTRGVEYTVIGRKTIVHVEAANLWLSQWFDHEEITRKMNQFRRETALRRKELSLEEINREILRHKKELDGEA